MRGGRRGFLNAYLAVLCERLKIDPPRPLRNLSVLRGYSGLGAFDLAGASIFNCTEFCIGTIYIFTPGAPQAKPPSPDSEAAGRA
jgi:hypothetical protein